MLGQAEVADVLSDLGICHGDHLMVHSAFRNLGSMENGPDGLLDALLQVIGPSGNLMLPTFNFSYPLPEPYFDSDLTPGRTGVLCEAGRRRGLRSLHPTHSVTVIGPDAEHLTHGHLRVRAFGVGSPIDRLAKMGGKVLLLGVGQTSNSTIHVGEEYAKLPKAEKLDGGRPVYARVKRPDGKVIAHLLDSSPSCSIAFSVVEASLREVSAIRDAILGNALVQCMSGEAVIETTEGLLRNNPAALVCTRRECASCRGLEDNLSTRS